MPDLERMRLDHVVRRPTPRGVIAPRPVTTTLRMTSLFGDGGPQDRWRRCGVEGQMKVVS